MRRSLLAISLGCAFAATAARAIRLPNDFAEAHWLLDYRYGLIKRGLAGSLLDLGVRFGIRPSESTVTWISCALFVALSVALVSIAIRILARLEWSFDAYLVLAVFLTSPFVVTAAHLVGYLDQPNFLLTLVAVWLALEQRLFAAGAVAALATLVHEAFVLIGLPLALVAAVARMGRSPRLLMLLAPPLLAFGALAASEGLLVDRAELRTQLVRRLSRFPFIARDMNLLVPEWLTTTLAENVREQSHRFADRLADPLFLRLALPSAVVLWLLASRLAARGRRWPVLVAAAMAAPLLLHVVAWDTARIWTYPLFAGFVSAWVAVEIGAAPPPRSAVLAALAAAIVLLNVFARYPLLDGEVERFTDLERLMLYGPFFAGSAAAAWFAPGSSRSGAEDATGRGDDAGHLPG